MTKSGGSPLLAFFLIPLALCASCTSTAARQGSGATFEDRALYPSETEAKAAVTRLRSPQTLEGIRSFLHDTLLPEGGESRVWLAKGSLAAAAEQRVRTEEWFQDPRGAWLADLALAVWREGRRVRWEATSHVVGFDPGMNALVADVYALRAMWIARMVAEE